MRNSLLVAVGFLIVASMTPARAQAAQSCWQINQFQTQCEVGLPSDFADAIASTQETQFWCWAASAQMIFRYYGLELSQAKIVSTVFGEKLPLAASPADMQKLLTSQYEDAQGDHWQVTYRALPPTLEAVVPELSSENPLLISTRHHAMVLTGLDYVLTPANGVGFTTTAIVRDPFPLAITFRGWAFGPGKRVLTLDEFQDIVVTSRVYVQRL